MNNTLEWVKNRERRDGGIEAWTGVYVPYPEVSGYLIPTLLNYKEKEMVSRLAKWLVKIQNSDGSWSGLDGLHHTFDTAAVVEGLKALPDKDKATEKALERGINFIKQNLLRAGIFKRNPKENDTAIYTARINWIVGEQMDYWSIIWNNEWGRIQRTHYIAYLLEGLWNAGCTLPVKLSLEPMKKLVLSNGLMPYNIREGWVADSNADDICATIQLAILYYKNGDKITAGQLIRAVEPTIQANGGIWQSMGDQRCISWAAKYYLDYLHVSHS